ncbi:hypothetical protein ACJRO7_023306 [Eucalyptus globulus]|uniref:Uncharacterized protein n=1 Tax=Eucalyptus globulus TaxID=34317 RepID=A0ABD3K1Y3_EUCGL
MKPAKPCVEAVHDLSPNCQRPPSFHLQRPKSSSEASSFGQQHHPRKHFVDPIHPRIHRSCHIQCVSLSLLLTLLLHHRLLFHAFKLSPPVNTQQHKATDVDSSIHVASDLQPLRAPNID